MMSTTHTERDQEPARETARDGCPRLDPSVCKQPAPDTKDQSDFGEPGRTKAVGVAMVAVGGLGALATLVALLWGLSASVGVAVGASLALGNLWALQGIGRRLLGTATRSRALWALVGVLKLAALLVGVGVLLGYDLVEPLSLIVGYAALPAGITIGGLVSSRYDGEI